MIKTIEQAAQVQQRRRESGKRGRAKAVRRWFKRSHGASVDVVRDVPHGLIYALRGNFDGCRSFSEARDVLNEEQP